MEPGYHYVKSVGNVQHDIDKGAMMAETQQLERVNRCQFCGKPFARRSWFIRHACQKKKKFEKKNDIVVMRGYRLFLYWLKTQSMIKKNRSPSIEKFIESPHHDRFVELSLFAQEHGIPAAYTYVDWLIRNRVPDSKWSSDDPAQLDAFKEYIKIYEDPTDQAKQTLYEIRKWVMHKPDRTGPDFFDQLSPGKILTLVQQRILKPWVLFTYPPIIDKWLADEVYNPEVFYKINDLVNCAYWADKIGEMPEVEETVIAIMDEALTWD